MMVKRSSSTNPEQSPILADGHLTDAAMMLAIDGELSAVDRELVKKHVRACWRCRARREHLERTIAEIVEYEHYLVAPDMPPPVGGHAMFVARLDELASQLGRPTLQWRAFVRLLQASGEILSSRLFRFAAIAVVIAVGLYLLPPRETPVVSAAELLQRALASESRSLTGFSQPVVVQKLSIDINGHKLARTIYRDAVRKRMVQRTNVSASEETEAAQNFNRSSFNWDDPLSPDTYSHWREGISSKQDSVMQVNAGEIRLDTKAEAGPVAQASLTFRSGDYHPVSEEIHLRDSTRIEVAEISYEVVGLSSLADDIFGAAPRVDAAPRMALHAVSPSPAQLEAAELDVYLALHGAAADMGEQITVHRAPDGQIAVDGITENEARKQQITSALAGIPFASQHIESIAEAMAHMGSDGSHAKRATLVTSNPPLLEDLLKNDFPDASQRTEFVTRSMALCQDASAHAWALNRLADRYQAQDVTLLEADERSRLRSLLNDHLSALREDVIHLKGQLAPVLASQDSANTTAAASPPTDWRADIHRVHASVELANNAVAPLLVGATGSEEPAQKLQTGLRSTLIQLQNELDTLEQLKYP